MKTVLRPLFFTLFFLLLFILPVVGFAQPWHERQLSTDYEERWGLSLDVDRGITAKDPYVWRYTSEFAARYGMPEQWITEHLSGVDAVAFRVTFPFKDSCDESANTSNIPNSDCITPIECRLDLYVNEEVEFPNIIPGQFQGIIPRLPPHSAFYLGLQAESGIASLNKGSIYQNSGTTILEYSNKDGARYPAGIISQYDRQRLKDTGIYTLVGCDAFLVESDFDETQLHISNDVLGAHHDITMGPDVISIIAEAISTITTEADYPILNYDDYQYLLKPSESNSTTNLSSFVDSHTSPYIWAYTQEFADAYGMPREWVNTEMQGVQAIAYKEFREDTGFCMVRSGERICGSAKQCQIDLYLDRKADIPWINPGQLQGFHALPRLSQYFLLPQVLEELPGYNPSYTRLNDGTPKYSVYAISSVYGGSTSTTFGTVVYHDQLSLPSVDIVSIKTGCSSIPSDRYLLGDEVFLELNFMPPPENPHAPFVSSSHRVPWREDFRHQVRINKDFIERMNEGLYELSFDNF